MITIVQGDLLKQPVDAIVNPANSFLRHGAGLAKLIDKTATDIGYSAQTGQSDPDRADKAAKWRWENRGVPSIPTGGVHVTSAGVLPFKGVIHAVGPIWGGGNLLEEDLLELVHENICAAALEQGWKSIAIPAISCGLFRFPIEKAAPIAVRIAAWMNPLDVTFALFEDVHFYAYAEAADAKGLDFELRSEMDEVHRVRELAKH